MECSQCLKPSKVKSNRGKALQATIFQLQTARQCSVQLSAKMLLVILF
uniref:Uncharacterized protein n=1 Tax=Arundo donax TaxID=35708 RepID=A0A0A8ZE27_ARUDO